VDFSGDGVTDLINQPIDAIGSVANYFVKNGWLKGQPVTSSEHLTVPQKVAERANTKRKVQYSAQSLRAQGAPLSSTVNDSEKLGVLMLNVSEVAPKASESKIYIVRAGDTACEIAEDHHVSCKKLRTHNRLNKQGTVYRGQRLNIPSESGSVVSNSTSSDEKPRYFFTHENFYVITRYNQSVLYAMAVHDLSTAIAAAKVQYTTAMNGAK